MCYYLYMKFKITKEALRHLSSADPILAGLISKYGVLDQDLDDDLFRSIVDCIVSQQLSNKAASSINGRIRALVGEVTAENLCNVSQDALRACGISKNKASYIIELSRKICFGEIDLSCVYQLDDTETIRFLTSIKGVGEWTAEMIALFSLGKENIFSFKDVALLNSIKMLHGLDTLSRSTFEAFREKYSPYCSVASIYYYYAYDTK